MIFPVTYIRIYLGACDERGGFGGGLMNRGSTDITQELGVTGMPTFHLFKDGDMQSSVTGAKAKALEDAIAKCYEGKIEENAE